jgi:hypothetical protein
MTSALFSGSIGLKTRWTLKQPETRNHSSAASVGKGQILGQTTAE